MIREVILGNFATVIIILLFFVFLCKNKLLDRKINKIFVISNIVFLVLAIVDSFDYYLSSLETLSYWRYVTSVIGYSLRPTILFLFTLILLRKNDQVRLRIYFAIPLFINIVFCLTSPFTLGYSTLLIRVMNL